MFEKKLVFDSSSLEILQPALVASSSSAKIPRTWMCDPWSNRPVRENSFERLHGQGSLHCQPKQYTLTREIPQNRHIKITITFALFDPSKTGNLDAFLIDAAYPSKQSFQVSLVSPWYRLQVGKCRYSSCKRFKKEQTYGWWFRNPSFTRWYGSFIPLFTGWTIHPRWFSRRFLNHQQYHQPYIRS